MRDRRSFFHILRAPRPKKFSPIEGPWFSTGTRGFYSVIKARGPESDHPKGACRPRANGELFDRWVPEVLAIQDLIAAFGATTALQSLGLSPSRGLWGSPGELRARGSSRVLLAGSQAAEAQR